MKTRSRKKRYFIETDIQLKLRGIRNRVWTLEVKWKSFKEIIRKTSKEIWGIKNFL